VAERAIITFDLGGATIDGKATYAIEARVGDVIAIPPAPVRDGYTFLYWQGSVYYPGDAYTVTGDHTFTAVWQDASEEKSGEVSGGDGGFDTGSRAGNANGAVGASGTGNRLVAGGIPETGDLLGGTQALCLILIAVGALAVVGGACLIAGKDAVEDGAKRTLGK
jgi:hypothetical protein